MPTLDYSALVDRDADTVWQVLRKFGAIKDWHSAIPESVIEDGQPDSLVGSIRRLTLADGAVVRERLLSLDDSTRSLSYRFEEAPLPVDNYNAVVRVVALSDQDQCVVCWRASYENRTPDVAEANDAAIRDLVRGGHANLCAFLA